jgi:F0F1-type ATP synthase assembly protein I
MAERGGDGSGDGNWGRGLSYGLEVGVGVGVGYFAGHWVDNHWHTAPWGMLIGLMLGCFGGMYLLIKEAIKANKD